MYVVGRDVLERGVFRREREENHERVRDKGICEELGAGEGIQTAAPGF